MTEHNESFGSEVQGEDVEQHFYQLSAEDAQLVDELRDQYRLMRTRSARTLAHAWERIQQEPQASDAHFVRDERIGTLVPIPNEIERKSHMEEIKFGAKKLGRMRRVLNVLAAAVLLIVVVGSVVLVYSHFHASTGAGPGNRGALTSVTATSTQPASSSTPRTTPATGGTSLLWPVGQSTYWANLRYHQLTDYWVSWKGNADQWATGARASGWIVSQTPHVPSIIVLMPYVQGATEFGHVAVVEGLVANSNPTAVHTSNMDWGTNGGGWNIVSYANFTVGPGVYFIWHA